ncbi:MAG: hypothetical protein ACXITV_06365 [Luteibaculaceae bacterium]
MLKKIFSAFCMLGVSFVAFAQTNDANPEKEKKEYKGFEKGNWFVGATYSPYLENTPLGGSLHFGNGYFLVGLDYLRGGEQNYFGRNITGEIPLLDAHRSPTLNYLGGRTTGYQHFYSLTLLAGVVPNKFYFGINVGQMQESFYMQFSDLNNEFTGSGNARIKDEVIKDFLIGIHAVYMFDFGLTAGVGFISTTRQFNPRIGYTYTF